MKPGYCLPDHRASSPARPSSSSGWRRRRSRARPLDLACLAAARRDRSTSGWPRRATPNASTGARARLLRRRALRAARRPAQQLPHGSEALLDRAAAAGNVHRIRGEDDPGQAALAYEQEMQG